MTELSQFSNPEKDDLPIASDQMEMLLDMQMEVLGEVASSSDHAESLNKLCLLAEMLVPDSAAYIMTLDTDNQQLFVKSSASLPREAAIALNGLELGEGSCGNAVQHDQEMFVSDTSSDARWQNLAEYAEYFNIQACWSSPIHNSQHQAIGTFAISSFEIRTPDNFQRKVLNVCTSIAGIIFEREQHVNELKHLAEHDSLTGLINRRKFTQDAELLLRHVKRSEGKMAIIHLNMDNFKWINDDYGCEAGDEVLQAVAASLKGNCRDNELACRWGGDEFMLAIVCKGECQPDVTAVVLRNLRIFWKPISAGANDVEAKMSCGVGIFPADADNLDGLIHCAEQAMLNAKSTGRNKMSYYKQGENNK